MNRENYKKTLSVGNEKYSMYDITALESDGMCNISRLPYSIRVLLENVLRNFDGKVISKEDLIELANWKKSYDSPMEIAHHPSRVIMQDFTGVPGVVDLAAMRDAVNEQGKPASLINPLVPVDLIVDHSVQVDYYGTADSLDLNVKKEYERNSERYKLLKWAQKSFSNMRIVPPNSGICHQVNLEYLGEIASVRELNGEHTVICDTLVGTDSHTTMINCIGVMGWGVGGIEAEAVMLGQPYYMTIPEVVGVRLVGKVAEGVTGTDVVLYITQLLRKHKVVEKFVEFFGAGLKELKLTDRGTISNMSPEFGSTMGFFPVDEETLRYMRFTGREKRAELVEAFTKANKLFYDHDAPEPEYTMVLEFDLSTVRPTLAGPSRPQDRISLEDMRSGFDKLVDEKDKKKVKIKLNGDDAEVGDGSCVIAAITSCTNTSNPFVMLGAALLAKNACEAGLSVPNHVKTSLAPGSKVVTDYLNESGLMPYLEQLKFNLAAYGCTTCIGNSGPLPDEISDAVTKNGLNVGAVLSGNRNFEARIHQKVRANYLASPMLVVAFALAGRVDIDMYKEPVGKGKDGKDVYLKDIWPATADVWAVVEKSVKKDHYVKEYSTILEGDENWRSLPEITGDTYNWDPESTYIRRPPFFEGFSLTPTPVTDIIDARVLAALGDSVTTDHISPAGAIPKEYPAGQYLQGAGVDVEDFNSYGSRRGNHEVMMRGTFANVRVKNKLVEPKEGGLTRIMPEGVEAYIYDAAMKYVGDGTSAVVLGGKEYGTGSSRDWAAKGTLLLGVQAVISESFERIHRSNLVGMGVLPMVFVDGQSWKSLGLDGTEKFTILGLSSLSPRKVIDVKAEKVDGTLVEFKAMCRLDTDIEIQYYLHGGILPYVMRNLVK